MVNTYYLYIISSEGDRIKTIRSIARVYFYTIREFLDDNPYCREVKVNIAADIIQFLTMFVISDFGDDRSSQYNTVADFFIKLHILDWINILQGAINLGFVASHQRSLLKRFANLFISQWSLSFPDYTRPSLENYLDVIEEQWQ